MAFNFSQLFTGVPSTIEKLPIQEPLQMGGINQLFQQGLQNYNPAAVEKYAREQFQQQTIPSIAERFTAMQGGRTSSPAFASQLGTAGAGLEGQLANLRYQHGLNALKLGLTPQHEYMYRGEQPGLLEEGVRGLATSTAQALPGLAAKGAQYLFGGPAGQATPAQQLAQGLGSGAVEALGAQPAGPAPLPPQVPSANVGQLAQTAAAIKAAGPVAAQAALPNAVQALKQAGGKAAPIAAPAIAAAVPAAKAGVGAALKSALGAAAKFVGIPAMLGAQGWGWYQLYKGLKGHHHHRHKGAK